MKHEYGKQITEEELKKGAIMFDHMGGTAKARCRWIARKMRKGSHLTWWKKLKELNDALEANT